VLKINLKNSIFFCRGYVITEVIDDEHHFFLHCNSNKTLRDNSIEAFHKVIPSFKTDHPNIQIQHILNPQFDLLPTVCDFIKQSLELRK
jgi:hypothetical protein